RGRMRGILSFEPHPGPRTHPASIQVSGELTAMPPAKSKPSQQLCPASLRARDISCLSGSPDFVGRLDVCGRSGRTCTLSCVGGTVDPAAAPPTTIFGE